MLNHPVCGNLLQQPQEMNIGRYLGNVLVGKNALKDPKVWHKNP